MINLTGVEIEETAVFTKAVKKLQKRFKNIKKDADSFIKSIQTIEDLGVNLGNEVYKVRLANSNKSSGKSSGYRLISYLKLIDSKLYLLYIYDKSDLDNITENRIDSFIKNLELNPT